LLFINFVDFPLFLAFLVLSNLLLVDFVDFSALLLFFVFFALGENIIGVANGLSLGSLD